MTGPLDVRTGHRLYSSYPDLMERMTPLMIDETPPHASAPLVNDLRARLGDASPIARGPAPSMIPPHVALAVIQRRGLVNLPLALREALGWSDGQRLLLAADGPAAVRLTAALAPSRLFAQYDHAVRVPPDLPPSETVPRRWLDVETLLRAQAWPDSPQRTWFIRCDGGFVSARFDPSLLPDSLDGIGQLLPDLDRPARAHYVQTVLSWTGITLVDRAFYFAALQLWGADETLTWAQAVQRGRDAED